MGVYLMHERLWVQWSLTFELVVEYCVTHLTSDQTDQQ